MRNGTTQAVDISLGLTGLSSRELGWATSGGLAPCLVWEVGRKSRAGDKGVDADRSSYRYGNRIPGPETFTDVGD